MKCGPLGAAVVSDELSSLTSSASCWATVEITNINVSGEALHCHGKKNWRITVILPAISSVKYHQKLYQQCYRENLKDTGNFPLTTSFSPNSSDHNITLSVIWFSNLSYRTGIFVLLINNSLPHTEIWHWVEGEEWEEKGIFQRQ